MQIKPLQSFGNAVTGESFNADVTYTVTDAHGHEYVTAGLAIDVTPAPKKQEKKTEAK